MSFHKKYTQLFVLLKLVQKKTMNVFEHWVINNVYACFSEDRLNTLQFKQKPPHRREIFYVISMHQFKDNTQILSERSWKKWVLDFHFVYSTHFGICKRYDLKNVLESVCALLLRQKFVMNFAHCHCFSCLKFVICHRNQTMEIVRLNRS